MAESVWPWYWPAESGAMAETIGRALADEVGLKRLARQMRLLKAQLDEPGFGQMCGPLLQKGADPMIGKAALAAAAALAAYGPVPAFGWKAYQKRRLSKPSRSPELVLTFDDGPDGRYTEELLDILARYDVPAVFFVVGNKALKYLACGGFVSWRRSRTGTPFP